MTGYCVGGRWRGTEWPPWTSPHMPFDIVMPFELHGWLMVRREHTDEWSWALAAVGL